MISQIIFTAQQIIKSVKSYRHSALTQMIIGVAMKVHRAIGPGFQEVIYHRCMVIELKRQGLNCENEVRKDIFYEGLHVGSRRLDILVENNVILELKAVTIVDPLYYVQIINYLKIFKIDVGLLLNFGNSSLEYRRFANYK